jgi:hypothetical protein
MSFTHIKYRLPDDDEWSEAFLGSDAAAEILTHALEDLDATVKHLGTVDVSSSSEPVTAIVHTPSDGFATSTTTVEDVVHAETEYGDQNTVVLEHPDESMTEITGYGVNISGFTENT